MTPKNPPQLELGLEFYLQAFLLLEHDRSNGLSAGSIPWSSIARYAELYDLDIDDLNTLEHHVRAMEHALNQHQASNKEAS